MNCKAISVNTTTIGAELVADIFFELGGQGVSIIDSADIAELYKNEIIWDYIDENVFTNSDVVKVTGYTTVEQLANTLSVLNKRLEELNNNSDFLLGSLEISVKNIEGKDWENDWKNYYSPIELNKIAIIPSWLNYNGEKTAIRINPGMAFGTGEHESTKLGLTLLEKLDLKDKTVADIGCGSGILGIAAIKLGAIHCYFADIDNLALDNMRENARLNCVEDKMTVENASLLSGNFTKSDIILANITADILILLASQLPLYITDKTEIILSGIIKNREQEVIEAYKSIGLLPKERITENDWIALRF